MFTRSGIEEISKKAYYIFIGEFRVSSDPSDSPDDSDPESFDLDRNRFGCDKITSQVEEMVETNWEVYDSLEGVYGTTISDLIKKTVKTVEEESQCARLKFFNHITPGEDRNLIETCTAVAY